MADGIYRDPLIAMAVLACLFFLIIIVIFIIWCKSRRQVEVKTVTVQPKKKPPPTKVVTANRNGASALNGGKPDVKSIGVTDVEATISLDDDTPTQTEPPSITITNESEEEAPKAEIPENQPIVEPEALEREQTASTIFDDDKDTTPIAQKNSESIELKEPKSEATGETNESFQPDD